MFFKEEDLKLREVAEGIVLRAAYGEKAMMTIFEFSRGAVIPPHRHPHEQVTYIVEGEMEFTVEGESKVLKKGEGVVVGADMEHSARTLSDRAKAVDAWNPMREDYIIK